MNPIRSCPRPTRWSRPAAMPALSSTSIVGNSSGLSPARGRRPGPSQSREVGEQPWLVLHVAEHDDRVAVAGLEDGRQRERLVDAAVGVAEDDVVAVGHRLDGERLDRAGEERVAEVADDRADEHRRRAAQAAGKRVRPVAELARRQVHPLARLRGDRDPRWGVVEDARDGALRDAGNARRCRASWSRTSTRAAAGRGRVSAVGRRSVVARVDAAPSSEPIVASVALAAAVHTIACIGVRAAAGAGGSMRVVVTGGSGKAGRWVVRRPPRARARRPQRRHAPRRQRARAVRRSPT